jgi:hypothetical protein
MTHATPTDTRFSRRRLMIALAVVVIVLIAAVLLLSGPLSPAASTVAVAPCIARSGDDGDCIRFPGVTGTNLNGIEMTLPDAFTETLNFVVVSFDEGQLGRAQTWLPIAQEIAADTPGFAYYSVPAMPDMAPAMRALISGGLVLLVNDSAMRDVTVVLYLQDIDAFTAALDLPDRDSIVALLLNADGEVLWRAAGDYTPAAGDSLRTALENGA